MKKIQITTNEIVLKEELYTYEIELTENQFTELTELQIINPYAIYTFFHKNNIQEKLIKKEDSTTLEIYSDKTTFEIKGA